jgi:hypothetical protein
VPRFALAILVALLAFASSGASALVVGEPCSAFEQSGQEDAACPPMCVTCGCCAQGVEPAAIQVASSPDLPVAENHAPVPRPPTTPARDILHVPKPLVS